MATVLDIGALQSFSLVFSFLFVVVVVFAVLTYAKLFGEDRPGIHALIAVLLGIMTLFSENAVKVIETMAPWFVLFFMFIVFVLMSYKIFGVDDTTILGVLKSEEHGYIVWWVISICLIIGIGSLTSTVWSEGTPVYNESGSETGAGSDVGTTGSGAFWGTLFHPKVLTLALIFLIAMFTISKLTQAV